MYWTARGIVNFNFTGFYDYESGIDRYQWGIGSKPSMADVLPLTPLTAGRVLKDIKYAGGTQKMFVTPVVRMLCTGRVVHAAALAVQHSIRQHARSAGKPHAS